MPKRDGVFGWFELMTPDPVAAKAFYTSVLGWTAQDVPMPGMTYTLLMAGERQVGGLFAVPKEMTATDRRSGWIGYLSATDVNGLTDKVKRLGGKVVQPPADIANVGRFSSVTDPQGVGFSLLRWDTPGEPAAGGEPGTVGWCELHTTDYVAAFNFYESLFGWTRGEAHDMGPMGIYQLFDIEGKQSGGMFNSPGAQPGGYWLYYFHVGDIDAAAARVTAGGGKLCNGPIQVPGGGWIAQVADPHGAMFALMGRRG